MSNKNPKKSAVIADTVNDTNTSMVLISLSTDNKSDLISGNKISIAQGDTPAQRLVSASELDADIYLVSAGPLKSSMIQEAKKQSEIASNAFYTAVHNSKTSIISETLFGANQTEFNSPFTVFGKAAFNKFVNENVIPKNAFELNYIAEKTCARANLLNLKTKDSSANLSFTGQLSQRLKGMISYYLGGGKKAIHKYVFLGLTALLFFFIATRSQTAAISGDEFTQHYFSNHIVDYFQGKDDSSAMGLAKIGKKYEIKKEQVEDMKNYGCGFDTFCNFTSRWFGIENIMEWRHFWNAFFGFMAMFFGALIVRRATGGSWKYAWIALLVLFFTPRFFGDSLNNPKDVPFATGYVLSFYYMLKTFYNIRLIRISSVIGLIFTIGLGISIRIGGLLSIGILCAFAAFATLEQVGFSIFKQSGLLLKLILVVFVSAALGYFTGLIPWPYGMAAPIDNPMASLKSFGSYGVNIRQLFDGVMYDSQMLPKFYLLKYIWITTPLGILLGFGLFLAATALKKFKLTANVWMCIFAAVFPIVYIYITGGKVYGGLRHILFTLPMTGICAVLGYYLLEQYFSKIKALKIALPAAIVAITALPAGFIIKNHPMEYIYFNEIIGGVEGAYGKYEMDYYLASLKPSTEWFLENVARKNPKQKFNLGTYDLYITKYYCKNDTNVKVGFLRPEQRNSTPYRWDYTVLYNAYNDNYRLTKGLYPPPGTVFTPLLQGKPMGVVIKRLSYFDVDAKVAEGKKQYDSAAMYYLKYLDADPKSYEVYINLANVLAMKGSIDSAMIFAKKSLDVFPEYQSGLLSLANYCKIKSQVDSATQLLEKYLKLRPLDADNYGELADLLVAKFQKTKDQNYLNTALEKVNKGLGYGPASARCYYAGYNVCNALNDKNRAAQYGQILQALQKREGIAPEVLDMMVNMYNENTGKNYDAEKFGVEFLGMPPSE